MILVLSGRTIGFITLILLGVQVEGSVPEEDDTVDPECLYGYDHQAGKCHTERQVKISYITEYSGYSSSSSSSSSRRSSRISSDEIMDKLSVLLDEKLADVRMELTTMGETIRELKVKQDTMADIIEQKFSRVNIEENLIKSLADNVSVLLPNNHHESRNTTDPKYSLGQFHYYIISSLGDIKDNVGNIKMSQDISLAEIKESVNSVRTSQDRFIAAIKDTDDFKCPKGFFLIKSLSSEQCFKVFTESEVSWDEARNKCTEEGLVLAKPENPTPLVNTLLDDYGDGTNVWVDARGNGEAILWKRDQTELGTDSTYWYPEQPKGHIDSHYCVRMSIYERSRASHPGKPYITEYCSSGYYPLCEAIMDE